MPRPFLLLSAMSVGFFYALSVMGCSSDTPSPANDASTDSYADSVQPTADTLASGPDSGVNPTDAATDSVVVDSVVNTDSASPADGSTPSAICPGGSYPKPTLTGTPTVAFKTTGSGLFEGPVWLARGVLVFSDMDFSQSIPPSIIHELTPPTTERVFLANSGTNGMALDPSGNIIACAHDVQGLVRINAATGAKTTWINKVGGKTFNSPNDLAVRSDGMVYFSDPDWQLGGRTNQTGVTGLYRVTPDGTVSLIDGTMNKPNGVSLSPDEKRLYVDAYDGKVYTFSLAADGTASNRQAFASVPEPDGMAVDCAGNIYVASKQTVQVFDSSGAALGSIALSAQVTNLAFGGADHKTLFITAGKTLNSLAMNLPGYPY